MSLALTEVMDAATKKRQEAALEDALPELRAGVEKRADADFAPVHQGLEALDVRASPLRTPVNNFE